MNLNSFFVLAGTTAAAIALAAGTSISSLTNDAVSQRGEQFIPGLEKQTDKIASIVVNDGEYSMTVNRKGDAFLDTSGYPVKKEAARDLVASLSVLRIEEKKTSDPKRHADLKLELPDNGDRSGKSVEIKDKNGIDLASVLIGKTDYTVGGVDGGQYVRSSNDDQTYLVRGSVKLPYSRKGWFDNNLIKADSAHIESVTLTDSEARLVEFKGDGERLKLNNLPEGKVEDEQKIGRLLRFFESLDFDDVRGASKTAEAPGPRLSLTTKDGLTFKVLSVGQLDDKQHWVRIDVVSTAEEIMDKAVEISKKLNGFEFKLSSHDSEVLNWSPADLTQDPQS